MEQRSSDARWEARLRRELMAAAARGSSRPWGRRLVDWLRSTGPARRRGERRG